MLLHKDDTTIKSSQLKGMGFHSDVIYTAGIRLVAAQVEEGLQRALHDAPLGVRCWRSVAKGHKCALEERACVVFLTWAKIANVRYQPDGEIATFTLEDGTEVKVQH